jgi:GNAT superfamily N-acetyltransferase
LSLPSGYFLEPLGDHDREGFSCGKEPLDRYLKTQASQDRKRDLARCYVLVRAAEPRYILAYYTLSTTAVDTASLPDVTKLPYRETPCLLLGRLARDLSVRGTGLGSILLEEVFREVLRLADQVGVYALVVDALDDEAYAYYQKVGFQPLEGDRLFFTVKDIRATLRVLGG